MNVQAPRIWRPGVEIINVLEFYRQGDQEEILLSNPDTGRCLAIHCTYGLEKILIAKGGGMLSPLRISCAVEDVALVSRILLTHRFD